MTRQGRAGHRETSRSRPAARGLAAAPLVMLCQVIVLSVLVPHATAAMLVPQLTGPEIAVKRTPGAPELAVALYRPQTAHGAELSPTVDYCADSRSALRWPCVSGPAGELIDGRSRALAAKDGRRISGRVMSADGFGIAGVTLIASRIAPSAAEGTSDSAELRSAPYARFRVVADGAGFYRFDGIPDGVYTIRNSRHDEYESLRITVRAGNRTANLILTRN